MTASPLRPGLIGALNPKAHFVLSLFEIIEVVIEEKTGFVRLKLCHLNPVPQALALSQEANVQDTREAGSSVHAIKMNQFASR